MRENSKVSKERRRRQVPDKSENNNLSVITSLRWFAKRDCHYGTPRRLGWRCQEQRAQHLTEDEVEEVSITANEGLSSKMKVK